MKKRPEEDSATVLTNQLNKDSSPDEIRDASNVVYEGLSEFLFDKVNFISLPFSQNEGVTNTSSFVGNSRITDTAEKKFLAPGKVSRMRCNFYATNPNQMIGYILSPVLYDSFSSLNTFTSLDSTAFKAYIGIKIEEGNFSVVVKQKDEAEQEFPISFKFELESVTDTVVLEIKHFVDSSDLFLNNELIGSYTTDFVGEGGPLKSFLPLLSPVKSTDGTEVDITIENYQFIQNR